MRLSTPNMRKCLLGWGWVSLWSCRSRIICLSLLGGNAAERRNLFRLCDSRTQYMINILHLIKVAAVVIVAAVSAGCERPVEITWDASSLHRVTGGVYARVKVLSDGRLALVYSAGPAVCMRTSVDGGDSWSEASEIARDQRYNYTNSELLELHGGRLLYLWNARPRTAGECEYKIMGAVSDDGGATWRVQDIFRAGCRPSEGCWEPVALQFDDGHIELYFADESPYDTTSEQQITMMRSDDDAETWGEPQCVSFRQGRVTVCPCRYICRIGTRWS